MTNIKPPSAFSDEELLVIEGTDPLHFDGATLARMAANCSGATLARMAANCSDATLARMAANCSDATLARMAANCSDETLARMAANCSDATLARMAANCSGATLDRMAANCSGATLARMAANCSGATLDRIKAIQAVAPLEQPYTKLLAAITVPGHDLSMSSWHTCKTTHCLGGWITTLHPDGRELEKRYDMPGAAAIILRRSRPDAPLPNFYANNAAAMAFIRKRASEEIAA